MTQAQVISSHPPPPPFFFMAVFFRRGQAAAHFLLQSQGPALTRALHPSRSPLLKDDSIPKEFLGQPSPSTHAHLMKKGEGTDPLLCSLGAQAEGPAFSHLAQDCPQFFFFPASFVGCLSDPRDLVGRVHDEAPGSGESITRGLLGGDPRESKQIHGERHQVPDRICQKKKKKKLLQFPRGFKPLRFVSWGLGIPFTSTRTSSTSQDFRSLMQPCCLVGIPVQFFFLGDSA